MDALKNFLTTHHRHLIVIGLWAFWIGLALAIRVFLFQPFNIPSRSMVPTLLVGDHLFVSKYAYGYSRYAFPFQSGPVSGRAFARAPQRGDVVVFRLPRDDSQDYIKRVIGLPGDRVQVKNSALYINDQLVPREFLSDKMWRETLPENKNHLLLDLIPNAIGDNTPIFKVPADYIFVMGDNRDNSTDSRFMSEVGFVPMNNLIGRAEIIYFSIDYDKGWQWWRSIRWRRLGHFIQ